MVGYAEILVAFLLFLFLFLFHWIRYRNSPLTNWPVVGMLPGILSNAWHIHDYATLLLKHHGGTMEVRGPSFTNMNFVMTSDHRNVHHLTGKHSSNYERGAEYHEIFELLGDGIFNSKLETWKSNRRMIHSLLTHSKFELFLEKTIQKKVDSCLIPVLDFISQEELEFDLQDVCHRYTFDRICCLVLGFDPECLSIRFPEVSYQKAFTEMEEIIFLRHIVPRSFWKLQKWLQIGQEKKLTEAQKIVDQFIYERIEISKRKIRKEKNEEAPLFDMLTAYIEEEEMGQKGDKFLRDSALNLLVAGRDSMSAGLSWFFWLVATHPSVESRILEEMKGGFASKEADWRSVLGMNEVSKLVYLHAAICESLRLFPPVPYLHVCAINPDILPSGHRINPNTKLYYSLYAMGRMEETWGEDCLEFKPERWISEEGGIKHIPSYKFMAFSTGPRSCLGKETTMIEMKMVATAVLWNYQIKVVESHSVSPNVSVVLHMEHGLKVRLTKRFV